MKKILLLIGILTLCGCNEWLNVNPRTEKSASEMFGDYKGFRDALSGCYVQMRDRSVYGEYLTMSMIESMAQLWYLTKNNKAELPVAHALAEFDYEGDYGKTAVKNMYAGLYSVIVQANMILEALEEYGENIPDEASRKVIEGEAHAIRAFCHLDVLRIFGQMPKGGSRQVSLPYSKRVSKEAVPYYTYDEFILEIEKDLTAAENALEDNDPIFSESIAGMANIAEGDDDFMTYRQFRFNYYAVKALQARFYLYTRQSERAYASAKSVMEATGADGRPVRTINNAQYDYDKGGYALPSEWLMALTHSGMQNYVMDVLNGAVGQITAFDELHIKNYNLNDMFGVKYGINYSTSNRKTYAWERTNTDNFGTITSTIRKYYREPNIENMTVATPYAKIYQAIPLLRMSEMYLIAIETAQNLDEANTLYKEYLQAQNVNTNDVDRIFDAGDDVGEMLLDDYRREFYAEGQMFFTYKRLGMDKMTGLRETAVITDIPMKEVKEQNYVVPVPDTEVNPNL